jgi:HIP---CoA ligase
MTGYGLTEAGTITASRPGDSFEDIATTVGTPCEGFELRISGYGEVLARGYAIMRGYLDDPVPSACPRCIPNGRCCLPGGYRSVYGRTGA